MDQRTSTPPVPRSDLPTLFVLEGSCRGLEVLLSRTEVTLGRSRDCVIRFDPVLDRLVSAHHARILFERGQWWVEDLGSKNGTWRDRMQIHCPTHIQPNDEFTLGRPGHPGSVRFYIVFRSIRRAMRSEDPPIQDVVDALDALRTQGPTSAPRQGDPE